jgi:competence protein ComEC
MDAQERAILHCAMQATDPRGDAGLRLAGAALAWLAGVALQLQQALLWAAWDYGLAAAAGALALALALPGWRSARALRVALVLLGICTLGFALTGARAVQRLAPTLPAELEGQDVQLVGIVASLPQVGPQGVRFRFDVEQAQWRGAVVAVPPRIALGWYRSWHDEGGVFAPADELRAGERWRFTVRLRRPHGSVNPHGFDHELWLFEHGVRATGHVRSVRDATAPLRLAASAGYPVERLRQRVREAIEAQVREPHAAGVLAALAVGDQGAIERDDWELFRDTGVAHLMSISGLHVTMFAWLAGLGLGALWRRSPALALACPAPTAARLGGLLAAVAYAAVSGWGVPVQRTVWMLATATLLPLAGARWPWPLLLLAAAVVVAALDPWALLQPGFWLSFTAVGLLMASDAGAARAVANAAGTGWRAAVSTLAAGARRGVRTQFIATLGLAPLTLVFFQQVSLVGFVANLAAIPVVTLLVTPLALLGSLAAPLWSAGAWLSMRLADALGVLAALPGSVWVGAAVPWWAQAAGLAGGALAVAPLPRALRLLAVPLALPLLWPAPVRPEAGRFELLALDVGQGTAVLVRTQRHTLLYDAGPQYAPGSDAGQRVVLPLMRAQGERTIDRLVLSHRDSDHVGGAATLLRALPVRELTASLDGAHGLMSGAVESTRCEAGQQWTWDGVQFEILHPRREDYGRALKPNALSCVLRISDGRHSALLPGDIEREQEAALVAAHGAALRSDLLLVPHHGSRTSSTSAFLDAVQPRTAVAQAGYRNRFGHPAPDVAARYRERGIELRVTPDCGAYRWADGAGRCERERAPRYWHARSR